MKRRYSNALPFQDLGTGGSYSDVETHQEYNADGTLASGSGSSGSGAFDWGGFATGLISAGTTVVTSVFGKGDKYRADATEQMYRQEKQTNTILWVVIGLVVALGVFLLIRKTK